MQGHEGSGSDRLHLSACHWRWRYCTRCYRCWLRHCLHLLSLKSHCHDSFFDVSQGHEGNVLANSNPEVLSRLDALLPLLARALLTTHALEIFL